MRLKALVTFDLICLLAFPALAQDAAKPAPKKAAPAAQDAKKPAAKPAATPAQDTKKAPETKPAEQAQRPEAAQGEETGGPPRGPRDPLSTPTFSGLRLRSIGPAMTSGRVAA